MNPDNPYAAPQAELAQYQEPELLVGELPFLANHLAFQAGAARAREALGNAMALVLIAFLCVFILQALLSLDVLAVLLSFTLLIGVNAICWKFFAGLSQMTMASRLFLRSHLNWARFAFLVGWGCYTLKFAVAVFFRPAGRPVYAGGELLDNVAGFVFAVAIGLAALRLGEELRQSTLRRGAWLTMVFLGGSHLLILLFDASLFFEQVSERSGFVDWWGDSLFFLTLIPILWFLIGYFVVMGLLRELSQLLIRSESSRPPLAETVLDAETIARRRRMAEGQG